MKTINFFFNVFKWLIALFAALIISISIFFEINEIPIFDLKVGYKFITGKSDYKQYENISDIILFDSKGYHKSVSFNHDYLDKVNTKLPLMIAGDIKIDDLSNFKNKNCCIDISGGLETEGIKDINKIDKFLNSVHNIFS